MILDSYKTHSLSFQINYAGGQLIWDRAGAIAKRLSAIWPGLKLKEARPEHQIFTADRMLVQTAYDKSFISLTGDKVLDTLKLRQIKDSFEVWREYLELKKLERISTRIRYIREYSTIQEANVALLELNLARWPTTKVFDQPVDGEKNGLNISYRFEDKSSFSFLKVSAEQIKAEVELDTQYFDEPKITKMVQRVVIDFDRGLLAETDALQFRVDEWFKGYLHILRRDIDKVLKGST